MYVIVHTPESEQDLRTLQNKVSTVHSQAVVKYIKNLKCPKEQKNKLLQDLIHTKK